MIEAASLYKKQEEGMETTIENCKIIRKIRSGSRTESYLGIDPSGQQMVLTYLLAQKLKDKLQFSAHQEGIPVEEPDGEAERRFSQYEGEFKETALRIKGLVDDHVAETYGVAYDREKKQVVVISEYIKGIDFFYATRCLEPLQMILLFVQALRGLSFIHKNGYLHLNVKPSGIRVDLEGIPSLVKFFDFGFAVPKGTVDGLFKGTSLYMAPEIILDQRERVDDRADLYSFGILAYYCLTERHPTEHRLEAQNERVRLANLVKGETIFSPPSHYNKEVPKELDEVILKLIEREPESRPLTAAKAIETFYERWPAESKEMPYGTISIKMLK